MKKNHFFYFYYFLALFVIIINCVFLVKSNFFIDIQNVPNGDYQYTKFSPDKNTELKVYYIDLTVGDAIRITATNDNVTKNIYWQTGINKAKIKWRDDDEVVINGVNLDLSNNETFDCRSIRSIFNDGIMGR